MHTILYLKWITNKDLLCSTGNSAQWYVAGWTWSLGENGCMYMYGWVPSLFTWNDHSIVNRLYSRTKWKAENKNKMDGSETWPVCQYNFRATKSLTICERLSETKDSQPWLCWLLRCIIIFFTHSFNQPMCTECLWCVWSPTSYWTHRKTGKHTSNYYSVWWGLSRNHIPSAMEPQRKNLNQPGEGQGRRDSLLCFWSLLGLLGFKQSGEGRLGGIGGIEDGISDERERQLKIACRQGDSEKHDDKGGMIEWESHFKGKEW